MSRITEVENIYDRIVPTLRNSENWEKMLRQIAPFWKMPSMTEAMLLTEQNKSVTVVATYNRWQKLGRNVNRGERAAAVFTSRTDTTLKYMF